MGLLEQFTAGASFVRVTDTFTKTTGVKNASGSAQQVLGGAYILLGASATGPCRARLYADSTSRDLDASRGPTDFVVSESVSLILDVVFSATTLSLAFNPPVIGMTYTDGNTFWHISGSSALAITASISALKIGSEGDSLTDRSTLLITASAVSSGSSVSGDWDAPKGFIIISGSATTESRLRLYSREIASVPAGEISRAFGVDPANSASLIVDMMFDSASYHYNLVPVLEGYNWTGNAYETGTNVVGYVLQNRTAGAVNISSSLYIYEIEP